MAPKLLYETAKRAGAGEWSTPGVTMKLRRILCPTDFSEPAHGAWRLAVDLARQFGAELFLFHVVRPTMPPGEAILTPDQHERLWHHSVLEAERELDRLLAEGQPPVRITRLVDAGSPWERIVQMARWPAIDLIVMGTHGRTGVAHALRGSVAEKVVREAACPVLTVRKRGAAVAGERAAA